MRTRFSPALCVVVMAALPFANPEARAQDLTPAAAIGLELGPDTTVLTAPLNDYGYPDYVKALDEQLARGVSREENFWVPMWQGLGNMELSSDEYLTAVEQRLGISVPREKRIVSLSTVAGLSYDTPEGRARLETLSEQQSQAMSRPWSREEFPEIARWLDANQEIFAALHEASRRPKAYSPIVTLGDGGLMIGILLPHVQATRDGARLLTARAMLRLNEGDTEGAWDDLIACDRIARHIEHGWTLIEQLVGYAIRAIAQEPMGQWLVQTDLGAGELQSRWDELAPLLKSRSMASKIDAAERYTFLDTVLALRTHRTRSAQLVSVVESSSSIGDDEAAAAMQQLRKARELMFQLLLIGSDVNETLRYGNRMYDQLIATLQPDSHLERKQLLNAIEEQVGKDAQLANDTVALASEFFFASKEDYQQLPGRLLTGMLLPAITAVEGAQTQSEARAATLEAAFQIMIHFKQSGELPLSLADLDDEIAASLIDPFTGEPLKTVIDERGLVIYSIGRNGVDDRGQTYGDGMETDDIRLILDVAP